MEVEQTYWKVIQDSSEFYFHLLGGDSNDIPKEVGTDPVAVFDETAVEENCGRFAVYILWLKQQPNSFEGFCRLLKERKSIIDKSHTKLNFKLITTYNLKFLKYR